MEEAKTLVVSQDARDICVHLREIFCTPGETEAKGDWIYLKSVRHDSGNAEAPEQLQPFYQVGGKVPFWMEITVPYKIF